MNNQQANTKPLGDLFGYLQLENLNLVAWALLLASWTCTIVATARIDTVSSTTWVPILGVVTLACLLARWLSQYRYRLAAMVLVTLLLVADGIALRIFQSGQILYFAVPVIGLANYLIGPLAAGVALGGVILMAGVGLESGV
ncbi:MAG: hypothetical protein IT330_03445, partial [Anaerolineae bacterium]|nr:hypothetical protein [Anaerolineae bacterium]